MEKNPKACEPCRRRKIRCDGKTPCHRCIKSPEDCTYRIRTRVRKSAAQRLAAASAGTAGVSAPEASTPNNTAEPVQPGSSPSTFRKNLPADGGPKSDSTYSNVYQGVAAAHEHGAGREWTENSRLFYGPASQFAFLQQVHRGIISSSGSHGQQDREVQEGGAGLDLFLQRNFFFGTASRIDLSTLLRPACELFPEVPLAQAKLFLAKFKEWNALILPLFTGAELDKMLHTLYNGDGRTPPGRPSQTKALTLAILAVGALATPHTDVAEMLLAKAKYEAVLFDDTVSLQMIQYSLLVSDYHTAMGRPNQVYLHIGTACRKAFALGLHRDAANRLARPEDVQKYRTTLWALFVHENWHSRAVGRENALRMADISSPFPENQPLLVAAAGLAHIAEAMSRTIYTQRYDSLRKLYTAAETIHAQLKAWADQHGILGSAHEGDSGAQQHRYALASPENPASLILHNEYYHTILLTYRPFLVADFALASATQDGHRPTGEADATTAIWLRQACRTAIDSAQDCITYAHAQIRRHEACRSSRYNGFFFESSCAVLFFDILRHPSKFQYNVEFIHLALQALDMLIEDEPITNARKSIRQILRVVQAAIAEKSGAAGRGGGVPESLLVPPLPSPASFDHQQSASANFPFNSMQGPANQLMYFPDLGGDGSGGAAMPVDGLAVDAEGMDPLSHFHYDILATDLYSFFPLNVTPPSAVNNDPGTGLLGDGDGSLGG